MVVSDWSIGELADRVGLSRRAIRFYVQQGLLPAPGGRGRGARYDASHLDRLVRILDLQKAGHSLDAIRRIFAGGDQAVVAPPAQAEPVALPRREKPGLSARLWSHVGLLEGVELHVDLARLNPTAEQLLAIREAVRDILTRPQPPGDRTVV